MSKIKIFVDWEYHLQPLEHHNWINSSPDDANLIVSVNRMNKFNQSAKKALWLLEPRAIAPDVYNAVEHRQVPYDAVISHCDKLNMKNNLIQIHPCVPAWIEDSDQAIYEKTKNVSMIASSKVMCPGHQFRQDIANQLSSSVDLYGHGRQNSLNEKKDGLKDYRFSVAMENSCVDTYFTEKILDCFLTGTIPIYWGTKKVYNIFEPAGIIFLKDFMNMKDTFNFQQEYQSRKHAVIKNIEIAKKLNFKSADGIHQIVEKMF